ncbi:MAG: alpha/beta hydrolase [Acidimicrobiales bacterium]
MIRRRIPATGGVELSVCDWDVDSGPSAGVPFLLVHGLASNARLWDGVARRLAAADHPVVAVDQRGHGLSDKPDDGYDYETVCADLVAVLDHLGWDRAVVVGQSWGGNVVVEFAGRHPDRLVGACGIDGGTLRVARRFGSWEQCMSALTPPSMLGVPAVVLRERMRAGHPDWPDEGIDGAMACFEVLPDGSVAPWLTLERHLAILAAMYADDPARLYAGIEVPMLFIPAADPRQSAWNASKRHDVEEAVAAIPKARAVWFDPAEHDVHAQHPAEVTQVLLDHVHEGFFR